MVDILYGLIIVGLVVLITKFINNWFKKRKVKRKVKRRHLRVIK
jgi:hypothetical protein